MRLVPTEPQRAHPVAHAAAQAAAHLVERLRPERDRCGQAAVRVPPGTRQLVVARQLATQAGVRKQRQRRQRRQLARHLRGAGSAIRHGRQESALGARFTVSCNIPKQQAEFDVSPSPPRKEREISIFYFKERRARLRQVVRDFHPPRHRRTTPGRLERPPTPLHAAYRLLVPRMIRKDELSFVGGPAEWIIAKQREDARRVATAQRRNGYKTGYPPACAFLTPHA